jgi:hypothetical protein
MVSHAYLETNKNLDDGCTTKEIYGNMANRRVKYSQSQFKRAR